MDLKLLKFQLLLGASALGYGIIFLLCACSVVYMRHHSSGALRGDTRAARRVLLPAFQPLLWLLMAVSLLYTICFMLVMLQIFELTSSFRVNTEIYYSGRLFVVALPVLYLHQQAVTTRALVRASLFSLLIAVYNIPIIWLLDTSWNAKGLHYVAISTGILSLLVLEWMCLRPPERASRKTFREYAVFLGIYFALRLSYIEMHHLGPDFAHVSYTITMASIFWGSLVPVVIWRILKADTAHWRGLGRRAVHLQSLFRQKHNYLHERVSSRGLHVLIEMHRKQIIDFAYLKLQKKIGVGGSAVVFRGTLHSKIPIAIKVYTPRVLCEDVVAEFSHEAALCGALHHPNVVRFYGMCVYPPAVCLVSELCRASLEDVTRASAKTRLLRRNREGKHKQDTCPVGRRQCHELLVDLKYMIDATRAVVYMHSFTPAFLHRDIKPSNFMVDDYGTCKLTDFGESRSLPTEQKGDKTNYAAENYSSAPATAGTSATVFCGESYRGFQTPNTSAQVLAPPISLRPSLRDRGRSAMTVRGTADYMAPELIEGKAGTAVYGEAADIYSLGITLWDIIHPLVPKYPEATRSHLQVFDSVLNGERPPLSQSLHPKLHRLFTDAWNPQPELRPSATYILTALETLQQELSAQTALCLVTALSPVEASSVMEGQFLMQRMIELDVVDCALEAYRMGNSLMSTGFLHHAQHEASFRKMSELFYFDANVVSLYASSTFNGAFQVPTGQLSSDCSNDPKALSSQQDIPSKKRHRATDSSVTTRCFSPPAEKKRSLTTASHQSNSALPDCACRKLGRGISYSECRQKRRFRRTKKWFSNMEESISSGNFLSHDFDSQPSLAETDEFEDYSNWEDMDSRIVTVVNSSITSIDEGLEFNFDDTQVHFESGWHST